MLGPAHMSTSSEKSRFKSAFGKLDRPTPKRLHPKALNSRRDARKGPISFFNSQRFDRSGQIFQAQSQLDENGNQIMNEDSPDQMIDINENDARIVNQPIGEMDPNQHANELVDH